MRAAPLAPLARRAGPEAPARARAHAGAGGSLLLLENGLMESRKASATRSTIPLHDTRAREGGHVGHSGAAAPPPAGEPADRFFHSIFRPPARPAAGAESLWCAAGRADSRDRRSGRRSGTACEDPNGRSVVRAARRTPRDRQDGTVRPVERRRDAMAAARVSLNLISAPTTKQYENYVTGAVRRAATAGGRGTTIYVTISSAASGAGGAVSVPNLLV